MPPRAPRADAVRNRQRVLDAAAEIFGRDGIDVPMSEVARHAGVGIATLIRNFPDRADLIAAVYQDAMTAYAATATAAAAEPDPWRAFGDFLRYACRLPHGNRGFGQVLTTMFPGVAPLEASRQRALRAFIRLVANAKSAGALRPDFSPHDLPLILLATGGVMRSPADPVLTEAGERLLDYFLQACAASNTAPLAGPPPAKELYRALERANR